MAWDAAKGSKASLQRIRDQSARQNLPKKRSGNYVHNFAAKWSNYLTSDKLFDQSGSHTQRAIARKAGQG
jgi:hypothetical protein